MEGLLFGGVFEGCDAIEDLGDGGCGRRLAEDFVYGEDSGTNEGSGSEEGCGTVRVRCG